MKAQRVFTLDDIARHRVVFAEDHGFKLEDLANVSDDLIRDHLEAAYALVDMDREDDGYLDASARHSDAHRAITTAIQLRGVAANDNARAEWLGLLEKARADVAATLGTSKETNEPMPLFGMNARELLATTFPKTRWMVHGLITDGGTAAIATEPKSAKTWLGTEIALAVATGTTVCGEFATTTPRHVAYFYAEDFDSKVQTRIRALLAGRRLTEAPTTFHAQPRGRFLDLTRDDDLAVVIASCRHIGNVDLLVLDPLRDIHSGDEDKSGDMSNVMRRLRVIGELVGCTVLIVHHAAKATGDTNKRRTGQRMRGSGAIHGSIDSGLYLSDLKGDGTAEFTNTVRSEVKGARSAGTFELTLNIQDDPSTLEATKATWTVVRKETAPAATPQDARDEARKKIIATVHRLKAGPASALGKSLLRPKSELRTMCGVNNNLASEIISELVIERVLVERDEYYFTEEPDPVGDGKIRKTKRRTVVDFSVPE